MDGWATIALRFAAYADLMLLAGLLVPLGLPLSAWAKRTMLGLAVAGIVIAVAQFGFTALAMVGGDPALLDPAMLRFLAFDTALGAATAVRIAALAAVVLLISLTRLWPWFALIALGSLAWQGHAGATEAATGVAHRASDVAHLVAGAVWLGALVRLLRAAGNSAVAPTVLLSAMRGFSPIGTLIVAALGASGVANLLLIADPLALFNPYGALLALKLALFGAMLSIAAANRWCLTPRLARALDDGAGESATSAIRRSLRIELVLALAVLGCVAVLGALDPAD
ncbi:copper homeostasis membrane protein CopD [Sphingomonas qomolangmaensis]|uniref:Copper homeostasis membrane protein CopD n=1 Tax=Sphingomonas qomolangmaensis TaxID=2918765 RepID=A0ABY5LA29_9SPHN|nr:copper homeostasis membrane protein CopD [Sphingomonas qomolangmaensis]UUL83818.1 copper homeostasis membrane protein CopD [Sphingomonas qomolangmaensis]